MTQEEFIIKIEHDKIYSAKYFANMWVKDAQTRNDIISRVDCLALQLFKIRMEINDEKNNYNKSNCPS